MKFKIGDLVESPEFTGRIWARTEYWDGRVEYLVRALKQHETDKPEERRILQGDLIKLIGDDDGVHGQ